MHPEAERDVEHDGPVFDQQISVARAPVNDARLVARLGAGGDDAIVGARFVVSRRRGGNRAERRDLRVLLREALRGLGGREAREADFVAGAKLPHLPQLGLRDGGRADEPAERGTIGSENDRHVAGEIDSADSIGIVVNVARMQPGLAAVGARPAGLGSDEADSGRIGVVVDLPLGGEEGIDIVGGEKIRRAVRAVQHADLPAMGQTRFERGGKGAQARRGGVGGADMQHVARSQRAPAVAAKFAEGKGRAAAEIFGNIDAAAHGDIGADAGPRHATELQHLPGLDGDRCPIGDRFAVERSRELGAGETYESVGVEF